MNIAINFLDYILRLALSKCRNSAFSFTGAVGMIVFFMGCQKQGTVELVDNDFSSQALELERVETANDPADGAIRDSMGFLLTSTRPYYGALVVTGAEYDGQNQHHEVSFAEATFSNSSQPVIINGTTVAFRTIAAGNVSVDNLLLNNIIHTITRPDMGIDTLGIQYTLLTKDGTGGSGFQYYGSHGYMWVVEGTSEIAPDTERIISPPKLHVYQPTIRDVISISSNLRVRWSGGGTSVRICICDVKEGQPPKPVLRLRVRNNLGGVLIPTDVLQLLPPGRSSFLFTFTTENASVTHVNGFQNDVLVRAEYNHNLLWQFRE